MDNSQEAAHRRAEVEAIDKRTLSAIAVAALSGYVVHVLADGFVAVHVAWAHKLDDLDALEAFVNSLAGDKHG